MSSRQHLTQALPLSTRNWPTKRVSTCFILIGYVSFRFVSFCLARSLARFDWTTTTKLWSLLVSLPFKLLCRQLELASSTQICKAMISILLRQSRRNRCCANEPTKVPAHAELRVRVHEYLYICVFIVPRFLAQLLNYSTIHNHGCSNWLCVELTSR